MSKNFLLASLSALALIAGSIFLSNPAHSAEAPVISSISPDIGPIGKLVHIQGLNFTGSNTIDWGFGRQHNVSASGATVKTVSVILGTQCPLDESCDSPPSGSLGYTNITVTNANGTSNAARYLLTPHNSVSGCYSVDNLDEPTNIVGVSCSDSSCNAGPCQESSPTPTPTPTPTATPTPTPTATPTVVKEDIEEDEEGTNGNSGSSTSGSVAGAKTAKRTSGTSGPSAADRGAPDFIQNSAVVATVHSFYKSVYDRDPNFCQSHFWKYRARHDKATKSKLLGAMRWQKLHGRNPIFRSCAEGKVAGAKTGSSSSSPSTKITAHDINRLFRATHGGVNPTPSQNRFWLGRLKDKPIQAAMLGAMQWHALQRTGY